MTKIKKFAIVSSIDVTQCIYKPIVMLTDNTKTFIFDCLRGTLKIPKNDLDIYFILLHNYHEIIKKLHQTIGMSVFKL